MTDEAMSPLRRRMIEDMTIRKFAPKTQHDYVQRVKNFAAFLARRFGGGVSATPSLDHAFIAILDCIASDDGQTEGASMIDNFRVASAVILLAGLSGQNAASAAPISSNHALVSKRQIVCDLKGCRPVKDGCQLEYRTGIAGGPVPTGGNVEVCRPH